jgi:hypothetical protein
MEGDEPIRYAGSVAQYVGQPLRLTRVDDAFELRWDDDLLGRLTRPEQSMVAETREGRWELRHSRRSVSRIDAVDPISGAVLARYRRRLLGSGGSLSGRSPESYRLRKRLGHGEWVLTGPREILTLTSATDRVGVDLAVVREAIDLGLLSLLCSYVVLLDRSTSTPGGVDPGSVPF